MAKLYFYYSAMNAGKTTTLLQSSYNYKESGMTTLLFKPQFDQRESYYTIKSRIGLEAPSVLFNNDTNLYQYINEQRCDCVLVDEAQFLNKAQVHQLCQVVDQLNIPVLAYGLRTDFKENYLKVAYITWAC